MRVGDYQHRIHVMLKDRPDGAQPFTLDDWAAPHDPNELLNTGIAGVYCPYPKPMMWRDHWYAVFIRGVFPMRLR